MSECPTCGGGLDEAIQWRDWQTVEMIQGCTICGGTGEVIDMRPEPVDYTITRWSLRGTTDSQ
jgi:DnaJ-class molecular chaperone